MREREKLGSRLGFILLSAGCAIGIGNVWRFPYMVGQYGGGIFVIIYLLFLLILGVPVMTMEYSIGRASRMSIYPAYKKLEKEGTKWHLSGFMAMFGNYLLLMFYSVVSGWILRYFVLMLIGAFEGQTTEGIEGAFATMMDSPEILIAYMVITMLITMVICSMGLQNGVEKITKIMMIALICIMIVLGIRSLTLQGASEGVAFYLMPNVDNIRNVGIGNVMYAALNQSFFTLSLGMGSMEIFGSYIKKERSLAGEAILVAGLDTFVAIVAGLITIPACFAYGVSPDSGPSLIFLTLPNVFTALPLGRVWGSLFFLFMYFAALSTMVGVFENIVSFSIDIFGSERKKAALVAGIVITLGSIPCTLGFNVLKGFEPLKPGTNIMDLEDFIVSNVILPIGSLICCLFCTTKYGWGFDKYLEEVNSGLGIKVSRKLSWYFKYVLPALITFLMIYGIVTYFK
ncbi:neurotransmitter:Na+ symporter, NSS family [Butyrivibrio sp. INlla18]|uniref:sodium-dependent transporter n=1 Tax=Butyrivibrio sp. INlla18 TaxID=1520806 RepID=UPI000890604A|nr:sodium-dependent transporter [Butyrivibrio sp. INlla18]SDA66404.1 neurotransmitter:Na+ symporter, NSS family [Butyrivibrio sp. INlla18]